MSKINRNVKMGFRITDSQPQDAEEKKIDIPVVDNAESR